jgi:hypothetical protein
MLSTRWTARRNGAFFCKARWPPTRHLQATLLHASGLNPAFLQAVMVAIQSSPEPEAQARALSEVERVLGVLAMGSSIRRRWEEKRSSSRLLTGLLGHDTRHLVAPGADEKREGRAHRVIYGSAVGGNDPMQATEREKLAPADGVVGSRHSISLSRKSYGVHLNNDLAAVGQAVVIRSNFCAASSRQRLHAFHSWQIHQ